MAVQSDFDKACLQLAAAVTNLKDAAKVAAERLGKDLFEIKLAAGMTSIEFISDERQQSISRRTYLPAIVSS